MTIQLRIAGPGLDVTKSLNPGDSALILGRDADCGVCLPDPQRNVSRRHLSVWNDNGELHFHVLSIVNGVRMPFGEAPPGARGVLPLGQELKLAEYALTAQAGAEDPWAVFDRDASGIAPVPEELQTQGTRPAGRSGAEEDPFGDWGFETTFGPGGLAGAPLHTNALGVAQDVEALFRGLGVDNVGALSEGELEDIGRLMRAAIEGLLELHAAGARSKQDLHAEDRTMVGVRGRGINPLAVEGSAADKLRYLFGGRGASVGFIAPDRAVAELVAQLLAHEKASRAAARAAVEGTLREFDPEALKARLLGPGAKLFESARAWDAYAKHYAQRRDELPQWAQQMLDRYFAEAYLRDSRKPRA
jgi:predicted component of type VI protein secretion system